MNPTLTWMNKVVSFIGLLPFMGLIISFLSPLCFNRLQYCLCENNMLNTQLKLQSVTLLDNKCISWQHFIIANITGFVSWFCSYVEIWRECIAVHLVYMLFSGAKDASVVLFCVALFVCLCGQDYKTREWEGYCSFSSMKHARRLGTIIHCFFFAHLLADGANVTGPMKGG